MSGMLCCESERSSDFPLLFFCETEEPLVTAWRVDSAF
jgi:hypothetical protein